MHFSSLFKNVFSIALSHFSYPKPPEPQTEPLEPLPNSYYLRHFLKKVFSIALSHYQTSSKPLPEIQNKPLPHPYQIYPKPPPTSARLSSA